MPAAPPPLHELETEIMDEIWEAGGASVREVLDALNARTQPQRAYTTILTVMQRLHAKDLLRRERTGRKDVYLPTMTRAEYDEARAETQVEALVAEYGDLALAKFSHRVSQLDPERQEQIRRLARGG